MSESNRPKKFVGFFYEITTHNLGMVCDVDFSSDHDEAIEISSAMQRQFPGESFAFEIKTLKSTEKQRSHAPTF